MFDKTWDIDNAKSAARLARMLKPYGIRPRKPRFVDPDGTTSQYSGYLSADFADAWSRWL
jgi:hypothetical protein